MIKSWLSRQCLLFVAFAIVTTIRGYGQAFQPLLEFDGTNGSIGQSFAGDIYPYSGLVQGSDGNLYGVTLTGGPNSPGVNTGGAGTFFKLSPSGELTTLYNFCSLSNCTDGADPVAMILGKDGNFYGVTAIGGSPSAPDCVNGDAVGCGTVFKLTAGGELTTLYTFCSKPNCTDGAKPTGLIQGRDGNLYGTTELGGANDTLYCHDSEATGCGTVFRLTPSGIRTTVYSFCQDLDSGGVCLDGHWPVGLVQSINGSFYGTTAVGGPTEGSGTVFRLTSAGALKILHSFTGTFFPTQLGQSTDGNFYGVTHGAAVNCIIYAATGECGIFYKITPSGVFTVLHDFCALANCADGSRPNAVVQASDGNFYGTTSEGGQQRINGECIGGCGTVFQFTPNGAYTLLYKFCSTNGACPDGSQPMSTLGLYGGRLYGTTSLGGAANVGTLFSVSPGVALAPPLPSIVNFGNQAAGVASNGKGIIIKNTNTGGAILDLNNFSVTAPFAISANNCVARLLAGKNCVVTVSFTPRALGMVSGVFQITDNAPGSPQTVSLSGTGVAQATLSPSTLNFTAQKVGTISAVKQVTLKNNLPSTLSPIAYSTTGPFGVAGSTCSASPASHATCTIGLTFSPTTTGATSGLLTVSDNASNSPQTVTLTGKGD